MKKLVIWLFFLILCMGILIHTMLNGYPEIIKKFLVPVMGRDDFEERNTSQNASYNSNVTSSMSSFNLEISHQILRNNAVTNSIESLRQHVDEQVTQNRQCATDFNSLSNAVNVFKEWIPRNSTQVPRKLIVLSLYDCEIDMFRLKLMSMIPYIDTFIIGEGSRSNSNQIRDKCFKYEDLVPAVIKHKVLYTYMNNTVSDFEYWEAEVHYRNQLGDPLKTMPNLSDDDFVIMLDMDELIAPSYLYYLKFYDPPSLQYAFKTSLRWSYYGFEWVNPGTWTVNSIISFQHMRDNCAFKANAIRYDLCGIQYKTLPMVGWHCSWCFPTRQYPSKLAHSAHVELNNQQNRNIDFLKNMRDKGLWFATQTPNACFDSHAPSTVANLSLFI